MDRGWTQFDRAHFVVPGKWVSPGGTPRWKRVVALDGGGQETEADPDTDLTVVALELEFPGGKWNLASAFSPAQKVALNGVGLEFSIGSLTGDSWSVGFCKPGELQGWRQSL